MKKLTTLILLLFMMSTFGCLSVGAATVSNDDIMVSLTTNQTEYVSGDEISLDFSIQNNSDRNISYLSYQISIPESLKAAEGTVLSGENIDISAGANFSSNIVFYTDADFALSGEEHLDTSDTVPSTGDHSSLEVWIFAWIFSVFAVLILTVLFKSQKKKVIKTLALLLTSCVAFSCAFVPASAASRTESIVVSENVLVDGQQNSISAEIKYSVDTSEEESVNTPDENEQTEYKELKIGTTPYLSLGYATGGVIPAQNENGKWGIIRLDESVLVDFEYDEYWAKGDDGSVSLVKYEDEDLICDVYLPDGTVVYHGNKIVQSIGAGVLTIQTGEREITYQKYEGSIIYKATDVFGLDVLYASPFNKEGYAVISRNFAEGDLDARVMVIDLQGNMIFCTEPSYDGVNPEDGSYYIYNGDRITGVDALSSDMYMISRVIPTSYSIDIVKVGSDDTIPSLDYACIEYGRTILTDYCRSIYSSNGLTILRLNVNDAGEWIDPDDEEDCRMVLYSIPDGKILSLGYTGMEMVEGSGYVLAQKSTGEWGYIDLNGNEIAFFDDASNFVGENAMVVEDGKGYVINTKLQRISEMYDCDGVGALGNNVFRISRGGRRYVAVYTPDAE